MAELLICWASYAPIDVMVGVATALFPKIPAAYVQGLATCLKRQKPKTHDAAVGGNVPAMGQKDAVTNTSHSVTCAPVVASTDIPAGIPITDPLYLAEATVYEEILDAEGPPPSLPIPPGAVSSTAAMTNTGDDAF